MTGTAGWLRDQRASLATDQILDAAARLFAERGVSGVGMAEVATAAGCSRATLYRYFDGREALRAAFVQREARRIGATVAAEVDGIAETRERLVRAMVAALERVRSDPALAVWFAPNDAGVSARIALSSDAIEAMVVEFIGPTAEAGPEVRRRARWVVRVLVSLLADPGDDVDEERTLIEEFVVPVVAG